jgi:hypothetical protein
VCLFEFRHGNLVKSALQRSLVVGLAAPLPETRD